MLSAAKSGVGAQGRGEPRRTATRPSTLLGACSGLALSEARKAGRIEPFDKTQGSILSELLRVEGSKPEGRIIHEALGAS